MAHPSVFVAIPLSVQEQFPSIIADLRMAKQFENTVCDTLSSIELRLTRIEEALQTLIAQKTVKDWYTTAEAAELLKRAEWTVREWCRTGRVKAEKRLCGRGRSGKRIANHLNNVLRIPSPDAGRVRTDHKIAHFVSGKWGNRTVLDLCDNAAIIGLQEWGRRSEGKHRRLGVDGARNLDDHDRTPEGAIRLVNNHSSVVVRVEHGYEPLYDPSEWAKTRAATAERGKSQKGISRAHDPSKYPLSCRVIDMTDDCGAIMYGRENGQRRIYICGRYSSTSGSECNNNAVDAEALLTYTVGALNQRVMQLGGHAQLRARLKEIAALEMAADVESRPEQALNELKIARKHLEAKIEIAGDNFALAVDNDEREIVRKRLARFRSELDDLERMERELESTKIAKVAITDDVEASLKLFDQLFRVEASRSPRLELVDIFQALNLRVGLDFTSAIKGKKRVVRVLKGGEIALGRGTLPVPLHGKNRVNGNSAADCASLAGLSPDELTTNTAASCTGTLPAQDTASLPLSRHEGVSFTKVSRGDRRFIFARMIDPASLLRAAISQRVSFTADALFAAY